MQHQKNPTMKLSINVLLKRDKFINRSFQHWISSVTHRRTWHGVHRRNSNKFSSDNPGSNMTVWLPQFSLDSVAIITFTVDVLLSLLSAGHVTHDILAMLKIITIIAGIPNISENKNEFLHLKPQSTHTDVAETQHINIADFSNKICMYRAH